MNDPYEGLGGKPLSRFRVIGFVIFALVMLGFYAYTTPDSVAHAYITGKCFKHPLPDLCHFRAERVVVPPALLTNTATP